ncbi:hypothetical protein [Paraliomyxa miuraensis]|uniref:hypothetical protein n=1 Tax=Paraliomyxa miuraensis TaxID=376150 RepID=UPI00225943E0|nr:hypothetical protein [Paraliomyxa miuraensis]MCX4240506.1 hypothetical protein [Paraliomyxa miuraensis]
MTRTVLTISSEQLATLGASDRNEFVDQIMPHLRAEHPAWHAELGDDRARGLVERAIETGARHAILGRQAVLTFIELCIEFGEQFERSPDRAWALQLLAHRKLPDTIKVGLLDERLRALTKGRRIVELTP